MRSNIAIDPDFQILEVTQKPHPPIFIINLYNSKDANNIYTIDRLKQIPVPQQQIAIYTGDWNIHHTNWSLDSSTRGRATQHKNWLDENNLTLINTPGVPTWQSNSGQQSILDLTFTNAPASNNSIIKNWQVNHELSFASDHFPITWTIDQGQKPTNAPTYNPRFNLKETETKKWTEAYLDEIDKRQIAFNNLNNTNLTQSQAEQAAIAIQEALIEATRKAARIARPSEKAKPWWNTEIQHALKNTRDWKTKAKQELYDTNSISSETKSANNKAIRNLRNKIKTEKRKWLQKTLEEADTNDIWAFRKWSKGARKYPTPPISRGPNRTKAIYAEDKADAICQELFQPPPDLPNTTTPT
jgi:hypothetical protein